MPAVYLIIGLSILAVLYFVTKSVSLQRDFQSILNIVTVLVAAGM